MNEINLKYKINKYIKKGNFNVNLDVNLDVSEYTYQLLKHKYINNKMTGGNPNIINLARQQPNSFFYVDLHGKLLVKEYVTIPDNLILILPSCCGKSNFSGKSDLIAETIDIIQLKNTCLIKN